uniref:Uncharacterized protein n=1 Tax=Anguilla anguilla TaxID=7936 RepID=A0A0E9PFY9_ANGAN
MESERTSVGICYPGTTVFGEKDSIKYYWRIP